MTAPVPLPDGTRVTAKRRGPMPGQTSMPGVKDGTPGIVRHLSPAGVSNSPAFWLELEDPIVWSHGEQEPPYGYWASAAEVDVVSSAEPEYVATHVVCTQCVARAETTTHRWLWFGSLGEREELHLVVDADGQVTLPYADLQGLLRRARYEPADPDPVEQAAARRLDSARSRLQDGLNAALNRRAR